MLSARGFWHRFITGDYGADFMSFLPPLKPLPSEIQFPISSSSAISRTKKSAATGHRRNCCGDARKISEGAWESALPPISLCRTTQTEPRTGRRGCGGPAQVRRLTRWSLMKGHV